MAEREAMAQYRALIRRCRATAREQTGEQDPVSQAEALLGMAFAMMVGPSGCLPTAACRRVEEAYFLLRTRREVA